MKIKEFLIRKKVNFQKKYVFPLTMKSDRIRINNTDFSIISDNCWGGRIYQELGIQYKSPFIGLFIHSPDYIKLLNNLKYYMNLNLEFVKYSKYGEFEYPVGKLDDIEIHFLHYFSEKEALEKWNIRKQRINWNNIFIKMNDSDFCNIEIIKQFDKLKYKNKVFFTAKYIKDIKSLIYFSELEGKNSIEKGEDLYKYRNYFDVVGWLNK